MKITIPVVNSIAVIAFTCALVLPAEAAQILTNGGFEAGFSGWSRADALGSDGTFFIQNGTASPLNGDAVPTPPGPINAAMSDGGGPGAHVLWQDFTISTTAPRFLLSFDLFIGNRAALFATPAPASLDFGINAANQQVRVDILISSAGAFSVAASDVLLNLYQSKAGDPLVSGYTNYSFDITPLVVANLSNTLRIRFAETDNLAELQAGVDNVSLLSQIPEPSSLLTMASGCLLGLATLLRRRKA
jgi:hypothetical protein